MNNSAGSISSRLSSEELHKHRHLLLVLGFILILLGFLAARIAFITTLGTVVFLGVLLTAGGIAQLIHAFRTRKWGGFFMDFLGGFLTLAIGILLLVRPIVGAASLTLFIGVFLLAVGAFRAFASMLMRFEQWGWYLLSGIIGFVLGLIILLQWPASSLWIIGLFVGIDLMVFGWSTVMLAFAASRPPETMPTAHA